MNKIIDVSLPYKDFDGYILMKFFSKYDYQQDFLNGHLFFNTSDFFAKCDDQGRGDCNEGSTFVIDYENPNFVSANLEKVGDSWAIVVRDFSENPDEYTVGSIWDYSSAKNRRRKIISLYTSFVNISNQTLSPFNEKMKKEFGEYGIIITNRQEFFSRVCNAIYKNKENSNLELGFVRYLLQEDEKGIIDWSPFTKKSKFSYQNEFRITFLSQNTDSIKVDLDCSLRDIAVPICTKDLNKIHFKNGNLLYPKYSKIRLMLIRSFSKIKSIFTSKGKH